MAQKMASEGKTVEEMKKIHLQNLPFVSTKVILLMMDEKENKYLKEELTSEQLE